MAHVGKNTRVIKLHAHSGASGITGGAFSIVPFNPKLQAVPMNGEWLCKIGKVFPPLRKDAESMPVATVKGTLHWMPVPSQFNATLRPLIPFAMRGAASYQGRSNVGNPLNKQDAVRRLALVALANTYGIKDLARSGPVFGCDRNWM